MNVFLKIFSLCLLLPGYSEVYGQCGWVYGKVVDSNTGERLSRVVVSLIQGAGAIEHFTTQDDGNYWFKIAQEGEYQLVFKKTEYDDFSYAAFPLRSGDSIRKDAPLRKPPRFIRITEVNDSEKEIKMLDVGALRNENVYYVDFFNSGEVEIEYVTGKMNEWITDVTPSSGTLKPNESNRIAIKINPDKFEAGKTTGKVLVITNNGNKVLPIKAIGKFPEVTTVVPDALFPRKFQCQISFNGRHTFKEVGYCFSDENSIPTVKDPVVLASMFEFENYEYDDFYMHVLTDKYQFPWFQSTELFDPKFACRTYYVRAYLKYENENDTIIYSRNVEQFTLWEILCP